ncbi:hypothetical protein [Luteibacter sp. dw_328]|uniref:hypothetical protein n=1 Tax=Luteibacter sp. dw_328 TaxID=2719796 RepID=UPI0021065C29|nr:hypothetical protein [Luteibacter sp. dw_328]
MLTTVGRVLDQNFVARNPRDHECLPLTAKGKRWQRDTINAIDGLGDDARFEFEPPSGQKQLGFGEIAVAHTSFVA